jgi:hypothetical protein
LTCTKCSPIVNPYQGYAGTVTLSSVWPEYTFSGYGTILYSLPQKSEATRAQEVVNKWLGVSGNTAKALIDAAVQTLIDNACTCDSDDEDEDDE